MSSFPKLLHSQIAVVHAEHATGIILTLHGRWKLDSLLPAYHIFSSEQEAVDNARSFLRQHPSAGAPIYDSAQSRLHYFTPASFATTTPLPSPAPATSQTARIAFALGLVYVVWSSTYLAIRVAIESVPPLLMAGARFLLAGALLVAYARLKQRAPWPTARQWRDAAVVGACLLLVGNGGVTLGERSIPYGLAAMLVATVPLFMGLFGW